MKHFALGALACAISLPALANEYEPIMRDFYDTEVAGWAADPVIIEAIRAQNAQTAALAATDIEALDQKWASEVGAAARPTIDAVLDNAASDFLRERVAQAQGAISEVFVMDAKGLNVAASDVTSDYWQGDEAKFQQSFGAGPAGMHIGDVEFDESSQTYQSQLSVTIVDPETQAPLGALTVGINPEALF